MLWAPQNTMKKIKQGLTAAATIAILGFSTNAYALDAPAALVPSGLNPGDTFFVVFAATNYIDACADAAVDSPAQIATTTVTALNNHGTTTAASGSKTSGVTGWQSLYIHDSGSVTNTVQASGAWGGVVNRPIYNTLGNIVATDRADLFSGSLTANAANLINFDQNGNTFPGGNFAYTGFNASGVAVSGRALGARNGLTGCFVGDPDQSDFNWAGAGPSTANRGMYVLSPLLTVPGAEEEEEAASEQRTQQAIGNQLGNHARNLMSQSVGLSGLVTGTGFGGGGVRGFLGDADAALTPLLENAMGGALPLSLQVQDPLGASSGELAFSMNAFNNWRERIGVAKRGDAVQPLPAKNEKAMEAPINVWVKGRWSQTRDDRSNADIKSDFGVFYAGGDFRYSDSTRFGIVTQLDWFEEKASGSNPDGEGHGWMVGPYVVSKLDEWLIFDARASAGRSDNKISPLGTYTDSYDTVRWQVESNLTGWWKSGNWDIQPSVGLAYFEDEQQAYTDSNDQRIESRTAALGRFNFGPTVSYSFDYKSGIVIRPTAGLKGIWQFKAPPLYDTNGRGISNENLLAQASLGINATMPSGTDLTFNYTYDGIGVSNYSGHGVEFGLSTPLCLDCLLEGSKMNVSYGFRGQEDQLEFDNNDAQTLKLDLAMPF